jgi:hypothetical protein
VQVTTEAAPDGGYVLTVTSPVATLQKRIYPGRSELEITAPGQESLKLVVTETGIEAQTGERGARVSRQGRGRDAHALRALVSGHPTLPVARGLARFASSTDARAGEALRLSDALLGVLSGDSSALSNAMAAADTGRRVRLAQRTTQECWEQYSRDASRLAAEYHMCLRATRWYEVDIRMGCGVEYVLRAEMAFGWLIGCNGGSWGP